MFDAINAIEREFEPYRVQLRTASAGRPTAAAAQAAHDVLVALNPAATAAYDALLRSSSATGRPGSNGAARASAPASRRKSWRGGRTTGGSCRRSRRIPSRRCPGRWQPTPPANAAATFTHVQQAAPLAMVTPTQFLPVPPPIADERGVCDRPQRGEADRQVGQRHAHAGADGHRAALGERRGLRQRHRDALFRHLEQHRARPVAGACR